MPEISGLELQQELIEREIEIPIVFITGYGDVPMAVEAMKSGAVDFIQKPFRDQDLLDCINTALQKDRELRVTRAGADNAQRRLETLTPREAEVLEKVVQGCANKVIAMDLHVSQRTVELHRARVMQKMGVRSVAELVQLVSQARQRESSAT
jgi:FixJ family two-component response regulator